MDKTSNLKLNKSQIEAIEHGKGPLLIIAGAGTGKTTVITERIKYLITKGFAKPEEVLALTFTEKAAAEMEERVDVAMPLSYGDIWIMTFHSFCSQILRDEALQIGLPSNFKLMTEAESLDLFKKNLFNFSLDYFRPLGNPNKFISEILKHFSRLQDEVVTPSEYLTWAKKINAKNPDDKLTQEQELENKKWRELATVYKEYDDLKAREAKFDYGDLIIKTIELFKKRPNILKKYREKFKYILVDEYQDTNFGQNELVNLIAQKDRNITIVGDDNQSIYRFRGAAISNILKFKEVYEDAKMITLNDNYRSTQTILDSAYALIKHNDPDTLEARLGISKKLIGYSGQRIEKIEFIHTNNVNEEAERVVEEILRLVDSTGSPLAQGEYKYSDIAILVRANNHADPFIRELERRGIPNQFLGPSKLFEKEEVADLISYLKVLYDPQDSVNFYRLISSSIFAIKPLDLIRISTNAKRKSVAIFEEVMDATLQEDSGGQEVLKKLISLINKHLSEVKTKTAGEMLYEFLNEFGVYEKILESEEDTKAKNISAFFQKIKDYENQNPTAKLMEVVDYIDLLTETGETPQVTDGDWQENNAVNILTVHSSKGLEFPVVFLVNLVNERFPGRNRNEQIPIPDELIKEELPIGDFHLEEERRLFYVGMTRAKERLYLTAADFYGDGKRKKKLSPFIFEALGMVPNFQLPISNFQSINQFSISKQELKKEKSNKLKIDYLSVSQIETFQTCPLHYKLKYIYKIPTPPSASISFGISIHNTLKEMLKKENAKKLNAKWVLEKFRDNFVEDGFINKKHKLELFKKGELYLQGFLKNGYDSKIKTILLEEKFNIVLSTKYKVQSTNHLKIGGTIDRVDELPDGRLEIIDYKTGATIPTQKEVDKDLQLSFYALAMSSIRKIKPEDIKLSLYYLDTQEKITTTRTTKDLEAVKKEILEIRDEIQNSDFKCNNNFFCQGKCEYSMFCKSEG